MFPPNSWTAPKKDEHVSHDTPDIGCGDDTPMASMGDAPDNRHQHAASVQGITGEEVKHPKDEIDVRQVPG
jgi:hypothetical protein